MGRRFANSEQEKRSELHKARKKSEITIREQVQRECMSEDEKHTIRRDLKREVRRARRQEIEDEHKKEKKRKVRGGRIELKNI